MVTKKIFKMVSRLNSFIIVANTYCKYYEDDEVMFDFCAMMSYIKELSDNLYFEISANEDIDS